MKFSSLFFTFALLLFLTIFFTVIHIDEWLVVDDDLSESALIIVLGGGGGSRLRKGLDLYEQGFSGRLLLVGGDGNGWRHIVNHLCQGCQLKGKYVDVLNGSISTFTDATLVKEFCTLNDIDSILIVTDPYHTRRVSLVFNNAFKDKKTDIKVVSSGFYGVLRSPGMRWWNDERTFKTVYLETIKSLFVVGKNLIE